MNQKHPFLYLIIAVGVFLSASFFIFVNWQKTNFLQNDLLFSESSSNFFLQKNIISARSRFEVRQKPEKRTVKGLYLTAYSAGSPKTMDNIISLIDSTELNAVVIDVKDYSGKVLYDSNLELVNEFALESNRLGDVEELIKKLHEHDIYVIARQTVFQDPILAEKKPEWSFKSKNGGLWRDNKGLAWVDASKEDVWQYDLAIAKEVIGFGPPIADQISDRGVYKLIDSVSGFLAKLYPSLFSFNFLVIAEKKTAFEDIYQQTLLSQKA